MSEKYICMGSVLPSKNEVVSIRQAARMLGVSLYTLRRWDKKGLIHSIRPDGNSRFFFITELQEIKSDQQYSISQAAAFLGLSPSTLRRLELRGLLCARRNVNKKRIYRQDDLKIYMKHREAK